MTIRAQLGLGDAVYAYPIVKHFATLGDVSVVSPHPIVFSALRQVNVFPQGSRVDLRLRYNTRRRGLSQYRELLDCAKLQFLPLKLDWVLGFTDVFKRDVLPEFTKSFTLSRKTLCIIKEPCAAHMHKGVQDFSAVPNIRDMQSWVDAHRQQFFYVSVGQAEVFKERLKNIDYDLNNKISVQDLITLCTMAKMIATQVGHLVPIAQGLGKEWGKELRVFYPHNPVDVRLQRMDYERLRVDR